jgi:hypothetical protein
LLIIAIRSRRRYPQPFFFTPARVPAIKSSTRLKHSRVMGLPKRGSMAKMRSISIIKPNKVLWSAVARNRFLFASPGSPCVLSN